MGFQLVKENKIGGITPGLPFQGRGGGNGLKPPSQSQTPGYVPDCLNNVVQVGWAFRHVYRVPVRWRIQYKLSLHIIYIQCANTYRQPVQLEESSCDMLTQSQFKDQPHCGILDQL